MSDANTVISVVSSEEQDVTLSDTPPHSRYQADTRVVDSPDNATSKKRTASREASGVGKRRLIQERNAVFDCEIMGGSSHVERKPLGKYPFEHHEFPICVHLDQEDILQYGAVKNQVFTHDERQYGEMSIEKWETAGIEICSQASDLISRLANLRRKRVTLVTDIQNQLHTYSQKLEVQDKSLQDNKRQVQLKAKGFLDDAMVLCSQLRDECLDNEN